MSSELRSPAGGEWRHQQILRKNTPNVRTRTKHRAQGWVFLSGAKQELMSACQKVPRSKTLPPRCFNPSVALPVVLPVALPREFKPLNRALQDLMER